jgi:hypothetical protein
MAPVRADPSATSAGTKKTTTGAAARGLTGEWLSTNCWPTLQCSTQSADAVSGPAMSISAHGVSTSTLAIGTFKASSMSGQAYAAVASCAKNTASRASQAAGRVRQSFTMGSIAMRVTALDPTEALPSGQKARLISAAATGRVNSFEHCTFRPDNSFPTAEVILPSPNELTLPPPVRRLRQGALRACRGRNGALGRQGA